MVAWGATVVVLSLAKIQQVDRSAAYAARWVAKHIVAAKFAKRCEIQLAYAIGVPHPVSIEIDTFGTNKVDEELLSEAVAEVFDLTPAGIVNALDLRRPIYRHTAYHGHFGRKQFPWEQLDRVEDLKLLLKPASKRQILPLAIGHHQ